MCHDIQHFSARVVATVVALPSATPHRGGLQRRLARAAMAASGPLQAEVATPCPRRDAGPVGTATRLPPLNATPAILGPRRDGGRRAVDPQTEVSAASVGGVARRPCRASRCPDARFDLACRPKAVRCPSHGSVHGVRAAGRSPFRRPGQLAAGVSQARGSGAGVGPGPPRRSGARIRSRGWPGWRRPGRGPSGRRSLPTGCGEQWRDWPKAGLRLVVADGRWLPDAGPRGGLLAGEAVKTSPLIMIFSDFLSGIEVERPNTLRKGKSGDGRYVAESHAVRQQVDKRSCETPLFGVVLRISCQESGGSGLKPHKGQSVPLMSSSRGSFPSEEILPCLDV